jgi:hypothetical protein
LEGSLVTQLLNNPYPRLLARPAAVGCSLHPENPEEKIEGKQNHNADVVVKS